MRKNQTPKLLHPASILGRRSFMLSLSTLQDVEFIARETLLRFFDAADPALIGMETCARSQWLAPKLIACGHDARIIPAKYDKRRYKRRNRPSRDINAQCPAGQRSRSCPAG